MFHQDRGCGEHTSYSTAPNRVAYTSDRRFERAVARLIQPKEARECRSSPSPQQSNTLGNASLVLSILSLALVFGVGLCALTGIAQKWIQMVGTPLFICGGSSAFLGFLGAVLGATGLFGKNRSKATAMVGLTLGLVGICLFAAILILAGRSTRPF